MFNSCDEFPIRGSWESQLSRFAKFRTHCRFHPEIRNIFDFWPLKTMLIINYKAQ